MDKQKEKTYSYKPKGFFLALCSVHIYSSDITDKMKLSIKSTYRGSLGNGNRKADNVHFKTSDLEKKIAQVTNRKINDLGTIRVLQITGNSFRELEPFRYKPVKG